MEKEKVRLNKSKSKFSTNKNGEITLVSTSTTRAVPYENIIGELNAYDLFVKERGSCNNYRINININPYCSNVLYNACTEVVKNECEWNEKGESIQEVRTDNDETKNEKNEKTENPSPRGKANPTRYDMIRDTEYSSNVFGYDYKCGLDIFTNHIIRSKVFRSVNDYRNSSEKNNFNTISDYIRNLKTKEILQTPCRDITGEEDFTVETQSTRLYSNDEVYSTEESHLYNIQQENGWFGFYNQANIKNCEQPLDGININRVINSVDGCKFIDMYPDRTLFSFNPKLNKTTKKPVYNWEEVVTYPYENFYNHNLVTNYMYKRKNADNTTSYIKNDEENLVNALYCLSTSLSLAANGSRTLLFRTATKGNIKRNDYVYLYFSDDGEKTYNRTIRTYRVFSVGDDIKENKDYYFTTDGDDVLSEVLNNKVLDIYYKELSSPIAGYNHIEQNQVPTSVPTVREAYIYQYFYKALNPAPIGVTIVDTDDFPTFVDATSPIYIRYKDVVYQRLSKYYILREKYGSNNAIDLGLDYNKIEEVVDSITSEYIEKVLEFRVNRANNNFESKYYFRKFRRYPNLNAAAENLDEETAVSFNKFEDFCKLYERKEGFRKEVSQLAFANTIYNDGETQVTITDTINTDYIVDNLNRPITTLYVTIIKRNFGYKRWYGIGQDFDFSPIEDGEEVLDFTHCFGKVQSGVEMLYLKDDNDTILERRRFLSDVRLLYDEKDAVDVFLDRSENTPISLEQWEGNQDGINESDMEFFGDLVEFEPYLCRETILSDVFFRFNTAQREYGGIYKNNTENFLSFKYDEIEDDGTVKTSQKDDVIQRREGYFYKAHYDIPIRAFGTSVRQGNHTPISFSVANPYQLSGMNIVLRCPVKHKLANGDELFICNDRDGLWYKSSVVTVINDYICVIKKIEKDVEYIDDMPYVDWISTCLHLNGTVIYDELEKKPNNVIIVSLSEVPTAFSSDNPEYIVVGGKYYRLSTKWVIRKKNYTIPAFATRVDTNIFLWRDVLHIGYEDEGNKLPEYVYANNAMYIDRKINFFLKRQDESGYNKLLYSNLFPDIEGVRKEKPDTYIKPTKVATC